MGAPGLPVRFTEAKSTSAFLMKRETEGGKWIFRGASWWYLRL